MRVLLVAGILLCAAGCGAISLNTAMEAVHYRYLDLFSQVEIKDGAGIQAAAGELLAALDDPAVVGYSSGAEYQQRLRQSREAVAAVRESVPLDEQALGSRSPLPGLRKKVFRSCQMCHDTFRR